MMTITIFTLCKFNIADININYFVNNYMSFFKNQLVVFYLICLDFK